MRWFIYNLLFSVVYFLMLPKFLFRMWKRGGYRKDFMQRFGIYDAETRARLSDRPRVWIHAVSVGEVFVALKFIEELRKQASDVAFVLSTTTSTGHKVASERLHDDDILVYFPTDFPFAVRRVLKVVTPTALLLTESEFWPNIIRAAKRQGVPVMLLNGRISESSYNGYRRVLPIFREVARMMDLFLVQSDLDRSRLQELGAPIDRIHIMNTVKYDSASADHEGATRARRLLESMGWAADDPIIVAGSTWPGEEDAILEIFRHIKSDIPNLRLILIPRHAERRDEVESVIKGKGLAHERRSRMDNETPGATDILLVDVTGESMSFYECASIVFVGKSLTDHGGQNIIEPALLGKPIIVGPNMENFPGVMLDFLEAKAIVQISDAADLEDRMASLLANTQEREDYGRRAGELVEEKRGVLRRSAEKILKVMRSSRTPDGPMST